MIGIAVVSNAYKDFRKWAGDNRMTIGSYLGPVVFYSVTKPEQCYGFYFDGVIFLTPSVSDELREALATAIRVLPLEKKRSILKGHSSDKASNKRFIEV